MQLSDLPRRLIRAFGTSADPSTIRTVPFDQPTDQGAASYASGFPTQTFKPIGSGGTPPDGRDVNGVLFDTTAWSRWIAAGGPAVYDATFVQAVGGYPRLSILASTAQLGVLWQSSAENNTTNPDSSGATNWVALTNGTAPGSNFYYIPGGLVDQWGVVSNSSSGEPVVSATLPVQMADAFYSLIVTPFINSATTAADTWLQSVYTSKTTTGFNVQYQRSGSGSDKPLLDGFEWRVVGRHA